MKKNEFLSLSLYVYNEIKKKRERKNSLLYIVEIILYTHIHTHIVYI